MEIYEVYQLIKIIDGNLIHIHWGYFSNFENAWAYISSSTWDLEFVSLYETAQEDLDSGQILIKVMEGREPKEGRTFFGRYTDGITWFSIVEIRKHRLPDSDEPLLYRTWSPAWGDVSHIYTAEEYDLMWVRDIASMGEPDCLPDYIRYSSEYHGQQGDHVVHVEDEHGRNIPVVIGVRAINSTEWPTFRRTEWWEQHPEIAAHVSAEVLGITLEEETEE